MKNRKNIITVAIDSPAAAGAGTQAKLIAKHYNLFYLDTGKIYRVLAYDKLKNEKKLNITFIRNRIKKLKIRINMNNKQKDEFNLQIRKILKQFGVKAHSLVEKRYKSDISNCEISIKLEIDSKQIEEIKTIIKVR